MYDKHAIMSMETMAVFKIEISLEKQHSCSDDSSKALFNACSRLSCT